MKRVALELTLRAPRVCGEPKLSQCHAGQEPAWKASVRIAGNVSSVDVTTWPERSAT